MKTSTDNAQDQASAQYESICTLVSGLSFDFDRLEELRDEWVALDEAIKDATDDDDAEALIAAESELAEWIKQNSPEFAELTDQAENLASYSISSNDEAAERIQEDALSVDVRSDWESAGSELAPSKFRILLCTGGPAVQIRGELNQYGEPRRAWLEYQDWGTPWTQYFGADQGALLTYAQQFYFGE